MENRWELCIGGVRGSAPATGREYSLFGGDTLSLRLQVGDQVLFIDGGSGLLPMPPGIHRADILLGHAHFDHLCGLSMWSALASPENRIDFYMTPRDGLDCRGLIDRLYTPPLWPIRIGELSADSHFHNITGDFTLGSLQIQVTEGNHPNGVSHFRISDGQRSLVYAVDTELTEENAAALAEFSRDCDLLIVDAMFTEEELPHRAGWGHSSMLQAAMLGQAARAKTTLFIHYQPGRTDRELLEQSEAITARFPACRAARQGEILRL